MRRAGPSARPGRAQAAARPICRRTSAQRASPGATTTSACCPFPNAHAETSHEVKLFDLIPNAGPKHALRGIERGSACAARPTQTELHQILADDESSGEALACLEPAL